MKAPCKDCPNRHPSCHAECEDYIAFDNYNKELVEELRNKKSRDNRELLDRSADVIERLAKELCKEHCHHLCNDTTDCVVEDEAKEVIANSATTTEKQIEEMARILCENGCKDCIQTLCADWYKAERLYNAGYRKQSEGEWIKINPNNLLIGEYYCSCCNSVIDIADGKETPLDREMYYCPNCGAEMKGGE